jgi:hypothetical protein
MLHPPVKVGSELEASGIGEVASVNLSDERC